MSFVVRLHVCMYVHKKWPHADHERIQCGDETDTDSNAYLVIEIQFVKVSQDCHISLNVHVQLLRYSRYFDSTEVEKLRDLCIIILVTRGRHCSLTYELVRICLSIVCSRSRFGKRNCDRWLAYYSVATFSPCIQFHEKLQVLPSDQ